MDICEKCGYKKDMSDLSTSIHFMSHPKFCPDGAWFCDYCVDKLELGAGDNKTIECIYKDVRKIKN